MNRFLLLSTIPLLLPLLAGGPLSAQSGPGFLVKPHPSFILVNSFNSVPGSDIRHLHQVKLPTDPKGKWTTALTVKALPAFFGGDGKSLGVLLGLFDPLKGTFTAGKEAASLNSKADERHLSLDPSGRWAVFERPDGVYLAGRTRTGIPFGTPRKVGGFGTLRDVHPYLGPVGGALQCFYTDGNRILMRRIDPVRAVLTGTPTVVSLPLQKGARPGFPCPLIGGDGDVEGLFFSEEVKARPKGDSDLVFAADLDPATPPIMVVQTADYMNAASFAGGFLSFAHDILPRYHVMEAEAAWMLGDEVGLGGTADLSGFAATRAAAPVQFTTVFLATRASRRIGIPGILGEFALNLATLTPFLLVRHAGGVEGGWKASFKVPNLPGLKGKDLALQGLSADASRPNPVFTNTAFLRLR